MCDEKKPQSKSITCHDHIQQQKLFSRERAGISWSIGERKYDHNSHTPSDRGKNLSHRFGGILEYFEEFCMKLHFSTT